MAERIFVLNDAEEPCGVPEFSEFGDYPQPVSGRIEAIDITSLGAQVFGSEVGLLHDLRLNSRMAFLSWFHVP